MSKINVKLLCQCAKIVLSIIVINELLKRSISTLGSDYSLGGLVDKLFTANDMVNALISCLI